MTQRRMGLAVREAPHVEALDEQTGTNLPAALKPIPIVTIGKIPGEIRDVPVNSDVTIRALFIKIGVGNLDRCEIQRNGQEANLDDSVDPGDTILAIAKIRGN